MSEEELEAQEMSDEEVKEMFFNLLQWVFVNRNEWIQEFKTKMEGMTSEQRQEIQWFIPEKEKKKEGIRVDP